METKLEKIKSFLSTLNVKNVDLACFATGGTNSFDELRDELEDQGAFDIEIIYYSTAIEYLRDNDSSLKESLGLAHEMGYVADNLSSEILASLLASQNARNDFDELESEIETFFEELEEIEEIQ